MRFEQLRVDGEKFLGPCGQGLRNSYFRTEGTHHGKQGNSSGTENMRLNKVLQGNTGLAKEITFTTFNK